MINIEDVKKIHKALIESFGGTHGIRDSSALESALNRPFQTFDGNDLYPSILEKAAALTQSILINHPFIDGNKRTGYTLLRLFLLKNGLDIAASSDNKYEFIINIASGAFNYEDTLAWLRNNVR